MNPTYSTVARRVSVARSGRFGSTNVWQSPRASLLP
jgi:hypothetical protein